jgi:hypothetical protein
MDASDTHNKDTTTEYGFPGNGTRKIRFRTSRRRFSLQMPLPSVSRCIMWFSLTSCGSSEKLALTILRGRISKPRQESAPHKVRENP